MIDRRGFIKTLSFAAVSAGFGGLLKAVELPRPGISMFALPPGQIRLLRKGKNTLALEFNPGATSLLIDATLLSVED